MEKVNVAVLGATGAVGRTTIRILQERRFPMRSLKLLASPHSAGKVIDLGAKTGIVEEFSPAALKDVDLVFGAVDNDLAEEYAPLIQRSTATTSCSGSTQITLLPAPSAEKDEAGTPGRAASHQR